MTLVSVQSILGLASVPRHRTSAQKWLEGRGISTEAVPDDRRRTQMVALSSLPPDVRRAYKLREIAEAALEPGEWDAPAHERLMAAPPKMQAEAQRKAAIARFAVVRRGKLSLPEIAAAAREEFGPEGISIASLKRILAAVDGVAPVNFAPALLASYRCEGASAEISEDAWSFFMTTIHRAGAQFPLKQAWRDVRDIASSCGWAWPSYPTVYRRWTALPPSQRLVARNGREDAVKALSMPIMRDKTTIKPLEWVSLDGRTLDFWVDWNGAPKRITFIMLVDVASNFVLDYELAESENAVATSRLIRRVCAKHGIFDRLYTDNGSAFAGHLVAGGAKHRWRGKRQTEQLRPIGACHHLGIAPKFALPANGQAKTAEGTFAILSRIIDDRPEFAGAHAGHGPGAAPSTGTVPVPFDLAERVIAREIIRHNAEGGRVSQGARGRSYADVFKSGLEDRIPKRATAQQLYFAGLAYSPASVDRWGRIKVKNWTYGGPETQDALLSWHKKGQVLVGRDPDDFSAPAVVFDPEGRLICRDVEPVRAGAYDSEAGAREAARLRKAARDAVRQAEAANTYLDDAEFAARLKDLDRAAAALPHGEALPATTPVVAPRFGSPLQPKRAAVPKSEAPAKSALTPEMLANLDRTLDLEWARLDRKSV